MRTFVLADATSHKFWNIHLEGTTFTVQFGKVGTAGQTQSKSFADADEARNAHDKVVAEKLKKGYRETTVLAPASLQEALEQAILDNPDDRASLMAYADWLSEQNDPRGELISTQLALEDESLSTAERNRLRTRERELLKAHLTEWCGEWLALARETEPEGRAQVPFRTPIAGFENGLLTTATLHNLTLECARAIVREPRTRFIRKLFVGGFAYEEDGFEPGSDVPEDADEDGPSVHVLLRWPYMSRIRVFQLGWTSDEVYQERCWFQCHLNGEQAHHFVKQMPHLEELYLFAHNVHGSLYSLALPKLRILQVYHSRDYAFDKLARNPSLGYLTHLLCHPAALEGERAYITLESLRALTRSPHLGSLSHLQLRLADFGDEGCDEIVRSGLLKRLKFLDLRHGCITDAGARVLAASPDLKQLQMLDLSRNTLTTQGIDVLRETGVPLSADYQRNAAEQSYPNEYLNEGDYE